MIDDIIVLNKHAFNELAPQYNERWRRYLGCQESVLNPFEECLRQSFADTKPITVLDVGCGVGLDSYILAEHGFQVQGIDIAEQMVEYSKLNVPRGDFQVANVLTYTNGQFHGILMEVFLHLFPKASVSSVLDKAKSFLVNRGVGLITTTKSDISMEGYFEKNDYRGNVKRFRKYWTEEELKATLKENGLTIIDVYFNSFFDKHWMNVLFQVSKT